MRFRTTLRALLAAVVQQWLQGGWRMLVLYVTLQALVAVIAAPVIRWLFVEALGAAGLQSVEASTLGRVFTNPLSFALILLLTLLALCAVSLQLMVLVMAVRRVRLGETLTAGLVLSDTAQVLRKLVSPGSITLLWYLFAVLPLAQFGFLSVLTHTIAVPSFVSGELVKSVPGLIAYIVFLVIAGTINVRLAFTLPLFALSSAGGARAMRLSVRLTRGTEPVLQIVIALVVVSSGVLLAALVFISLAPTALSDLAAPALSPVVAAASLGLAQLVAIALVGFTVVALAAVLVELFDRKRSSLPTDVAVLELGTIAPAGGIRSSKPSPRPRTVLLTTAGFAAAAVCLALTNVPLVQALHVKPETLVLGHRGFSSGGVENTLSGLDAALAAGADLVEMDVMQTLDGGLVAMHDASLARLADVSLNVADLTLDEITGIEVHDNAGHTDVIPSFRDYVVHAQKIGMPLLIELKLHGAEKPGFVEDVVAELEELDALSSNMYHSLHKPSIEKLKLLRPTLYTGYTMAFAGVAAPATTTDFIVVEEWSYTTALRNDAWANGLGMFVWTVNNEFAQRQMLRDEVDGIITDAPDTAVRSREGMVDDSGLAGTLFDALMRFVVVI